MRTVYHITVFGFFVLLTSNSVLACSVCFGKDDSAVTQAANGAILFMLALLVPVLASFLGFIIYLVRKQSQPLPEHAILAELIEQEQHQKEIDYEI